MSRATKMVIMVPGMLGDNERPITAQRIKEMALSFAKSSKGLTLGVAMYPDDGRKAAAVDERAVLLSHAFLDSDTIIRGVSVPAGAWVADVESLNGLCPFPAKETCNQYTGGGKCSARCHQAINKEWAQ